MIFKKKVNSQLVPTMYTKLAEVLLEDLQKKDQKVNSLYEGQIINYTQKSKIEKIDIKAKAKISKLVENEIIKIIYEADAYSMELTYKFLNENNNCYFFVEEKTITDSKKVAANNFVIQYVWKLSFNKKYKNVLRYIGG